MFDVIKFMTLILRIKIFLTLIVVLFSSNALSASSESPRWFDIELIVFENSDQHWMASEQWPDDLEAPPFDNALDLEQQTLLVTKRLDGVAGRISRSSKYKLLLHTGWRQSVLPRDKAVGVRLTTTDGNNTLDGVVKISVERYLHVNFDLLYQKSEGSDLIDSPVNMKAYSIKGKRRIRSKELHYFDHPLVSMLVLVTPYKEKAEKVSQEKTDLPTKVLTKPDALSDNSGQIIR